MTEVVDNPLLSGDESAAHPLAFIYLLRSRTILFLMNNMILLSVFAIILIGDLAIFIRGFILLIRKKDSLRFAIGLVALSLLAEYAALFVFVPAATYLYFIIYNYASLLVFLCSLTNDLRSQKGHCIP